jgi:hypothetical protein
MNKRILAMAMAAAIASSFAQAADVIPVNFDGPNEGYNDTTPVAPVGGNPGTTLGEQRQIVALFAADLWGSVLESDVPIAIAAQFTPLAPNVLGSAGATGAYYNFPGVPANTLHSVALAEAIIGQNINGNTVDISSNFSSNYTFYYGLDGKTPAGQVNFLDVVMHEFGHGLGFQNFENEATGQFSGGIPDIYSTFTYDNTLAKFWPAMTVAERQFSAVNNGNVVFTGASAVSGAGLILGPRTGFRINSPAGIAGDYVYGTTSFGPAPSVANFSGNVVLGLDEANGTGPTTTDGCTPFTNAAEVAGNIALVERGTCAAALKTKNAQDAGATGVIIANNVAGNSPPGFSGSDPTITIATIVLTQANGVAIKEALPGVNVGFYVDESKLQGADNAGRPRLFMPNPVQGGSSGSHYDSVAAPNLLMEPAINSTLFGAMNIDITANLLQDTGWRINAGNAKIDGCDTGIDVVDDAGIIVGANVQAQSNVCLIGAVKRGDYQNCMDGYKERLVAAGLITDRQGGKMMLCASRLGK